MMSMTVWGTLRVDKFFQDYNWLGLSPKLETTQTTSATQEPPWLCLSVEEFFQQNNWRGRERVEGPSQKTVNAFLDNNSDTAQSLLTMPVGQFFQMAIWRGLSQPVVSKPVSKVETKASNKVSDSSNYNLSDLSDLF